MSTGLNAIHTSIARELGVNKRDVCRIADTFIAVIVDAVARGDVVQLRGFGTFRQVIRPERYAVNPQTGGKLLIPATTIPKFVPSVTFKRSVGGRTKNNVGTKAKLQ